MSCLFFSQRSIFVKLRKMYFCAELRPRQFSRQGPRVGLQNGSKNLSSLGTQSQNQHGLYILVLIRSIGIPSSKLILDLKKAILKFSKFRFLKNFKKFKIGQNWPFLKKFSKFLFLKNFKKFKIGHNWPFLKKK